MKNLHNINIVKYTEEQLASIWWMETKNKTTKYFINKETGFLNYINSENKIGSWSEGSIHFVFRPWVLKGKPIVTPTRMVSPQ